MRARDRNRASLRSVIPGGHLSNSLSVRGPLFLGGCALRFRNDIAPESNNADSRKKRSPSDGEDPSCVKDDCLSQIHGIVPWRRRSRSEEPNPGRRAQTNQRAFRWRQKPVALLLLRGRGSILRALLHACFPIRFKLLHLGLLVGGEQLEQLVVNAAFLHLELHQRLRLLRD
jgi:hypothetical protein